MQMPPGTEADNMLNRMTSSLLYRVDERCADLTVVFERGSKKDLQTFFPILIDNIFGPQGTSSWGLRTIVSEDSINEFNVLLNFLKPMGPLFKLIYNLLQDQTIKYDFSLAYLPMKVRQMLDGPNVHPFYSEVLQYNTQNKQIVSLLLNPFDYYMFHFAYHLINPCHQRLSRDDLWNTVYYNLCAEYLLHFFPSGVDHQILPTITYYHGKNPLQMMQAYHRSTKHSPLLKSTLFTDPQLTMDVTTIHQMIEKHPRNEIWRSETIMMAFLDLWLSNDQICCHYSNFSNMTAHHIELPSADYIRIIRVVVKHMHAFASTANFDHSPLGELKKITLPMMQTRMYIFLRNLVYRWPLDESFRLVLELWLSFIQPWRYSHDLYTQRGGIYKNSSTQLQAGKEDSKSADEDYLPFIAENLLVYVVIFQQLLPRFTRVDLASPKNAQMLFRLTKVFNQQNLIPLICKIEAVVENKNYSPNHTLNLAGVKLPPLSPTSKWSTNNDGQIYDSTHVEQQNRPTVQFTEQEYAILSNKYSSIVRQKIHELEGPNFRYKPLFITNAATEVYELLQLTKSAEIKAMYLLQQKRNEEAASFSLFSLFSYSPDIDKISLLDRQKAPTFLRCSADNLIEMFQIQDFNNFDVTPDMSELCNTATHNDDTFPNILTPERVRQRTKGLKYDGDPDLIPICSFEVKFLVRAFYDLSKKINETYGGTIKSLYYRKGISGRFLRNFIQAPTIIYKYDKRQGYSKRVPSMLPPRISLRKFAKRNFVLGIFIGSLLGYFMNYGPFMFIFLYAFFLFGVYFMRAVLSKGHTGVAHTGLNDSLDD